MVNGQLTNVQAMLQPDGPAQQSAVAGEASTPALLAPKLYAADGGNVAAVEAALEQVKMRKIRRSSLYES